MFNAIYDGTLNVETFALDSAHLERDYLERDLSASPAAVEAFGRAARTDGG